MSWMSDDPYDLKKSADDYFQDRLSSKAKLQALEELSATPEKEREALLNLTGEGSIVGQIPENQDQIPSTLESTARGAKQGGSLSWGDELAAGMKSMPNAAFPELKDLPDTEGTFEERFKKNLEEERRKDREAELAHPDAFGRGQRAGGVAAFVPAAASGPFGALLSYLGGSALEGAGAAESNPPQDLEAHKRLRDQDSIAGQMYSTPLEATKEGAIEGLKSAITTPPTMIKEGIENIGQGNIGQGALTAGMGLMAVAPMLDVKAPAKLPKGLYSKLGRLVEEQMPAKASAQQVMAIARKAKPEEFEYLGMNDFLQSKPSFTKEEVLTHINENLPELNRVVLTGEKAKYSPYTHGGEYKNYKENITQFEPSKTGTPDTTWAPITNEVPPDTLPSVQTISKPLFTSGHYKEVPNPLSTSRTTERIDIEGAKTLHGEESQSDIHQKGAKHGYYKTQVDEAAIKKLDQEADQLGVEYKKIRQQSSDLLRDKSKPWDQIKSELVPLDKLRDELWEAQKQKWNEANELRRIRVDQIGQVPDVPFKKTWTDLELKQLLYEAAQGNYDKLTLTTGAEQFKRWGSERIKWEKTPEGWKVHTNAHVKADFLDTPPEYTKVIANKDELDKFIKSSLYKPNKDHTHLVDKLWKRMQSEDSGVSMPRKEGNTKYYDEMTINKLNDLLKPLGAKVETTQLLLNESAPMYQGPSYTSGELLKILQQAPPGQMRYSIIEVWSRMNDGRQWNEATRWLSPEAAVELGGSIKKMPKTETVWAVRMTPELREKIIKTGFPLFAAGGVALSTNEDDKTAQKDVLKRLIE